MSEAATAYTHEFVARSLPVAAKRVLEVGCGAGEIAARLAASGLDLVAIDGDPEAVAAARSAGVDARVALWPDFSDGTFDAVLFTRSLHHVDELGASVTAAMDCLRPGGRIIVEDFDFGFSDEATFDWFAGLIRVLRAAGMRVDGSRFLSGLSVGALAPIDVWHGEHEHELHHAGAIEAALGRASSRVAAETSAYFFRYVAAASDRADVADALRRHELDLIAANAIRALGRRYVAEK